MHTRLHFFFNSFELSSALIKFQTVVHLSTPLPGKVGGDLSDNFWFRKLLPSKALWVVQDVDVN